MVIKKKKKALKKKSIKKTGKKAVGPKIKRRVLKASLKPKIKKKLVKASGPKEELIGVITHYFPHVKAAVFKAKTALSLGDKIRIKGHTTDFVQTISSMQIERSPIAKAKKGDEIGLLVTSRVRRRDKVTKVR